jgi:hypothetical protein
MGDRSIIGVENLDEEMETAGMRILRIDSRADGESVF